MDERILRSATAVLPDRLYFLPMPNAHQVAELGLGGRGTALCTDRELVYEPFFADFGPLSLTNLYRYCQRVNSIFAQGGGPIYHLVEENPQAKSNNAVLIGAYAILFGNSNANEVFRCLNDWKPFAAFRDASCGANIHQITVMDCLRAIHHAADAGLIDFHQSQSSFSIEEHEHYERLEHGDLTWIIRGKAVAFSGPSDRKTDMQGFKTLVPEDYWDYFKRKGVTAIVRLNEKVYDKRRWTSGGFKCYELFFPDGTCPSESILRKFLDIMDKERAVAVHCKAGLGRTGTLIGCYLMKTYQFPANQAIAYLRICRPGMVIGTQQRFLRDNEVNMLGIGHHSASDSVAIKHAETETQQPPSPTRWLKHVVLVSSFSKVLQALTPNVRRSRSRLGKKEGGANSQHSGSFVPFTMTSMHVGRKGSSSIPTSTGAPDDGVADWRSSTWATSLPHRGVATTTQPKKVVTETVERARSSGASAGRMARPFSSGREMSKRAEESSRDVESLRESLNGTTIRGNRVFYRKY